jgi:AraC-like DNA-binding protein
VAEVKNQKALSNYTEQCKDYIYKNFHNKIYLEDIAAAIGVSPGHLSRVFRNDMEMSIQDYIQKFRVERAANLLKYSEASLSEISHYTCFHSQSHFGSVFKRYMGMTPRQYRDKYKEKEFQTKK